MRAEFDIPGTFPSVANLREHWAAKAKRAKAHRAEAALVTTCSVGLTFQADLMAFGGAVTLTRMAPRKLDSDNLASALKGARDGIAESLGFDDGDPALIWRYAQEKCPGPESRVRVVVEVGSGEAVRGRE